MQRAQKDRRSVDATGHFDATDCTESTEGTVTETLLMLITG
jgi:hypothetical protein